MAHFVVPRRYPRNWSIYWPVWWDFVFDAERLMFSRELNRDMGISYS